MQISSYTSFCTQYMYRHRPRYLPSTRIALIILPSSQTSKALGIRNHHLNPKTTDNVTGRHSTVHKAVDIGIDSVRSGRLLVNRTDIPAGSATVVKCQERRLVVLLLDMQSTGIAAVGGKCILRGRG